jgi:hypothetical protein
VYCALSRSEIPPQVFVPNSVEAANLPDLLILANQEAINFVDRHIDPDRRTRLSKLLGLTDFVHLISLS